MTTTQEKPTEQIYVCSWGATMTIVNFYRVIKETEHQIVLREILGETIKETGFLEGECKPMIPADDKVIRGGEYIEIRATKKEGRVYSRKTGYYKFFYLWDGKPAHFNHCD